MAFLNIGQLAKRTRMATMRARPQSRLARVEEKLRELIRLRDGLRALGDAWPALPPPAT